MRHSVRLSAAQTGRLKVPSDMRRVKVHEFKGAGVAMAQFNTDAAITGFAHTCFKLAVSRKMPLYLATKDTILQVYDARFKTIFDQTYQGTYKAQMDAYGAVYEHRLIDDMVAIAMKSSGGYVWACKNYDGDVQSEVVAQGYGSRALMRSMLHADDGNTILSEASHGTVHRHFVEYNQTGEAWTNPMSTVLTWTQGLRHRAQLDDNAALAAFSDKLEQAMADVVDAGTMTKDLASAIHKTSLQREHNVTSGEFVDAVALRVQGVLGLTL